MRMIRKQAQDQGMTVDDFVRYYQSPEYTSEYDQPAVRPMVQQPQTNQAELEARWQKMLADRPMRGMLSDVGPMQEARRNMILQDRNLP